MADKRKLLELDIDVEAIIAKSVQLKTELDKLKSSQNDLKKSGDTNSETYVKLAAQLNKVSGEYNLNQKQLANLAQVNDNYLTINQKVGLSLDKEINSITAARQSNTELLKIRNELNLSKESEAKLAAEINAKLDANNKFIKENVSNYEQQKIGIGDYKTAIKGAIEESGLFGGQIQNITNFTSNFKTVYAKMGDELESSISQIKNAGAETEGLGKAQKASAIATEVGSGALRIFKLALAATGIGLLIIGVGLLVNGLSKLDPVMDLIEQATSGIGGAIDKASQIVVRFVSNITSIGDAFSKIVNLIAHPIDSIKSFSKEVGNAAKAAAKLKEAEQELGDLKDIYDVRNKNLESQIKQDQVRLKSKSLTAQEEQEIDKRVEANFKKVSENKVEINNREITLALANALNTSTELSKIDKKRLVESIRLGDIEVANDLLNGEKMVNGRKVATGKIQKDAYDRLLKTVGAVADTNNQLAENEERNQVKQEKAAAAVQARKEKAEAEAQKRRDEASKAIDAGIAKSKTELDLFIAQQGTKAKSLEESLKLEEQIRDKKLAISKKEFDVKKITQTEFELQSLNIKNEFLKKQAEITVANADIELKNFIDNNKSKIEANKFVNDELLNQELSRLGSIEAAQIEAERTRFENGITNKQAYDDAVKAIEAKTAEEQKAVIDAKEAGDLEKSAIDIENKIATDQLNADNEFAFKEADRLRNQEAELLAAQTNGANVDLINQKYAAQKKQLDKSVADFKLNQELALVQGIKGLFSEQSLVGKAAALAEVGITTYKNASASFQQGNVLASNPITAALAPNAYIQGAITIATGAAQAAKISGVKLARGAIDLDGPGTTTSDSIPANLSRGESVINAKSTAMFKPLLSAINQAGGGVGFAGGGIPYPTSVLNTFNNTQGSQPIDYDLLASKIGSNVAQANKLLPPNQLSLVDFHVQNDSYVDVVTGANF